MSKRCRRESHELIKCQNSFMSSIFLIKRSKYKYVQSFLWSLFFASQSTDYPLQGRVKKYFTLLDTDCFQCKLKYLESKHKASKQEKVLTLYSAKNTIETQARFTSGEKPNDPCIFTNLWKRHGLIPMSLQFEWNWIVVLIHNWRSSLNLLLLCYKVLVLI